MVVIMTREEIYQKFGPMLIEAIVLVIRDEINLIRTQAHLPERTNSQIMGAISNKLNTLGKYNWMNK